MPLISPGIPFPDRALPDLRGESRLVSEAWAAGPALLAIGHAECGTTRLALPIVDRLHGRRSAGSSSVAILQEDREGAAALVGDLKLTVPALLDEDPYPLSADLGIRTVPTLILVDAKGMVSRVFEGFSRADLEWLASGLGVVGPLFGAGDEGPVFRPG